MAIEIIDELRQKNNGQFPVVDANNVKGGYYQVQSIDERDAIPMVRRKVGMLCFCEIGVDEAENQLYQWTGDEWVIASLGGGGIESVQSQEEMFAIKMTDRVEGMLCYVKDDEKTYQLVGGIENEHWVAFSGGGGGGGTVANLNCDTPHSNTGVSEAPIVAAPSDAPVSIPFFFSSPNLGSGTVHIVLTNGGMTKEFTIEDVPQVPQTFTFPEPFEKSPSTYNVTMWAVDRTGQQSNKVYIRYQVALLELVTSEQNGRVYSTTQNIRFPYSISNALNRPVKVKEYLSYSGGSYELKNTKTVTNWGSIQYFEVGYLDIPGQYHVKIEVMTEDEETKGNELIRSFVVSSPSIPQVYTDEPEVTFSTDDIVRLKYRCAMSGKKELRVKGYKVFSDGTEEFMMQRDVPTVQENEWVIGDPLMPGTHLFRIYVQTVPVGEDTVEGEHPVEFVVHITQGTFVAMTPVEDGMIAQFLVKGDVNNESAKGVRDRWINTRNIEEGPHIDFHRLNYGAKDGWMIGSTQEDMYVRLTGRGYGIMDYQPFLKDHERDGGEEIKGWTFEILYRANNVGNEEARVLSCTPPGAEIPGIFIDTQDAAIGTNQGNISTAVEYDEWTHLMFVIHRDYRQEKNDDGSYSNVNFMFIYINGVLSRVGEIGNVDVASFETDQKILLNAEMDEYGVPNNFGSCDIREIRVYNRALDGDEAVRNYISTVKDPVKQRQEIENNERGSQIPTLTVNRRTIGVDSKGNPILEPFGRTEDKNKIRCHVEYSSLDEKFGPSLPSDMKLYPTSQIYYQGNSSLIYAKKNYKIRFRRFADKDLIENENGELVPPMTDDGYVDPSKAGKWKWSPIPIGKEDKPEGYNNWIPEDTFTLKTDYMESSHASNPGSARYIHDMYRTGSVKRLTPPQKPQYREWVPNQDLLRSTVDGFPVRMILDGVDEGIFIMLVDKNSKDTFGVKSYKHPTTGEVIFPLAQSFEISANSDIGAGAFRVTDLEAVQREFEPRFAPPSSYTDNLYGQEETFTFDEDAWYATDSSGSFDLAAAQKATPHHLLRLIKWVKETGEAYEAGIKKRDQGIATENQTLKDEGEREAAAALKTFKDAIQGVKGKPDYFDEGYLIDYYLFALTFGMVDNFGKNTFLTTWDGRVWYPNFYDMDSMLGIDNQGKRNRDVDLEIDDKDEVGGYHFNTSQSLLWVLTRNAFDTEIKARYRELRELNFFSFETASKYYMRDFMDKIPKRDYNRDAVHKYLNVSKAERASYLEICGGDRRTYVARWIKKRIIFMDSLMNYTGEYFSTQIALRANLEQAGWIELPIKTFSPQYVSIEFTTGNIVRQKCYPHKDTIFRGYIATNTNQEINIGNAEFIKEIGNVKYLRISEAYLENAVRLNKFDCSGSQMLKSLNIGPLRYLRELNCSGCSNLGLSGGGQGLDLSGCENLMFLNASSTQLVSIQLPRNGCPLVELNITNCPKLETLSVYNQVNITRIPLTGCENLSKITIDSCANLEEFTLPVLSQGKISRLAEITINNCEKIESLTFSQSATLKFLNLSKLPALTTLTLRDLSKNDALPDSTSIQTCLDLSQLNNLQTLTIANCNITSLRFNRVVNGVHSLRTLKVTDSMLKAIHYGSAGETNEHVEMSGLNGLETVLFTSCSQIEQILNFNYTKNNPGQLFRNCHKLTKVTGTLTLSGDCNYLFNRCFALKELPTLIMHEVTSANSMFEECSKINGNLYPVIIQSFYNGASNRQSKLRSATWIFGRNSKGTDDNAIVLPSKMFDCARFPDLTSLNHAFFGNSWIRGQIPGDLFGDSNATSPLTNVGGLFRSSKIETVHANLLKPLKKVTTMNRMFNHSTIQGSIPSGFFDNCIEVTDLSEMFYGCGSLAGSVKARWFDRLTKLNTTRLMFYSCGKLGSTESSSIPDELFKHNKALTDVRGMFLRCTSIAGTLPENLFAGLESDASERMAITHMNAMFGYTKITGEIPVRLLRWCTELSEVGSYTWNYDGSSVNSDGHGLFGSTQLTVQIPTDDLGYSLFRYNTKLKVADGVFKNCKSLNTTVPLKLFATNSELTNLSSFFMGCSQLNGTIPTNMISGKSKLTNAAYFFADCPNIAGKIPEDLFNGLIAVTDLRAFFRGCKLIGPNIPTNLFRGLAKLLNINEFFKDCKGLTGMLPAPVYEYRQVGEQENPEDPEGPMLPVYDYVLLEAGLFEDCVNLTSAKDFLRECIYVKGSIPEFIFRKNTSLTNLSGFFYNCNGLHGSVPVKLFETNRTLMDISYIFYHCNKIDGYIPKGLFAKNTALENVSYAFAWCRNLEKYPTSDVMTCVPDDLFKNCPLTNAAWVFWNCSGLTGSIPPLFSFKSKLLDVSGAFCNTKVDGPVTSNFMNDCTLLQRMECLFEGCSRLTSISKDLLTDNMNVVTNAKHCFKGCSNVAGEVPTFQRQPSANKTGAFAGMNPNLVTNYSAIQNWTTADLNHTHIDPYATVEDEYLEN